ERALAVLEQGRGDDDAALEAARAPGAKAPRGDRAREGRGPGRQLRLADPLVRASPLLDGQGPPDRVRGGRRGAGARRRSGRVRAGVPPSGGGVSLERAIGESAETPPNADGS